MRSLVTLKKPFLAVRPGRDPTEHDFSVFIVPSRDVKIMSHELCHLWLEVMHFNPFFARF